MAKGRKRKCRNPLNEICSDCGQEKPLDDFYANKSRSTGKSSRCKTCEINRSKKREANPVKKNVCIKCGEPTHRKLYCSLKCFHARYLSISPDGILLKKCLNCNQIKPLNADNYYLIKTSINGFSTYCKICEVKISKQWAASDKGKAIRSKNRKEYRKSDAHKQYLKKIAPARRANEAIRRRTDISFVLNNRMRCLMYSSLRGTKNGHKWQDLAGYSVDVLRRHIERRFTKGMSWERFLAGEIHIDHKIPVSAFNFISPDNIDFKKCWALKNLQPMWAHDNQVKHVKLDKPFQPSLLLRAKI